MNLRDLAARDAGRLLSAKEAGEALVYLPPAQGAQPVPFQGAFSGIDEAGKSDGAVGDLAKVTAISSALSPVRGGFVRRFAGTAQEEDFRVISVRKPQPYVEIFVSGQTRPGVR